jgi:hypothetical protein
MVVWTEHQDPPASPFASWLRIGEEAMPLPNASADDTMRPLSTMMKTVFRRRRCSDVEIAY